MVAPTTSSTEKLPFGSPEESERTNNSEFAGAPTSFVSFDGGVKAKGTLQCPDRYRFWSPSNFSTPSISRGAGLSYSAASFGEGVTSIDHKHFNRIIEFRPEERTIEVEAGMTLGDLYAFVARHNLFLSTQPGHPRITIGGCIAPDVHGKNQFRDGTFISQVLELTLFHPHHGFIRLSPTREPDLFRLTCGGYGLTGNIISAKLMLKAIPSTMAEVRMIPVEDIATLPEKLRESAGRADFVYSWHDFDIRGDQFGSGFIQEGRFIDAPGDQKNIITAGTQTLSSEDRGNWGVNLFNKASIRAINNLYGARAKFNGAPMRVSLFDSIFPIQKSKELYFKFFGSAGFYEYQLLVPAENFAPLAASIKRWLHQHDLIVTLASAKLFGGKQDLLRFSGEGVCICLDLPAGGKSHEFLPFLDNLTLELGGIPNIIKDSRLPRKVVQSAYPQYEKFKSLLLDFDPQRIYQSELSKRMGL